MHISSMKVPCTVQERFIHIKILFPTVKVRSVDTVSVRNVQMDAEEIAVSLRNVKCLFPLISSHAPIINENRLHTFYYEHPYLSSH